MDAVTTEPVIVGNLRIPAENFEEWARLNDEAHGFDVRGEPVPRDITARMLVLQGMSEADAKFHAQFGENPEAGDCRAVD